MHGIVCVDLGSNPANVLTLEVEPFGQTAAARRDYYVSLVKEVL